jgi:hypothetical protein
MSSISLPDIQGAGLDRRSLIRLGAGGLAAAAVCRSVPVWAAASRDARQWMDAAIAGLATKGTGQGTLQIARFQDHFYYLLSPITWRPAASDRPGLPTVTVPIGFVTDLTSIPRAFWAALPPDGDYCYAAVLHDYLYWQQTSERQAADHVLKIAMRDLGVSTVTSEIIFRGVQAGGSSAWSNNARLRAHGERRVLRRFPNDPRVKWTDWKRQPDVFV